MDFFTLLKQDHQEAKDTFQRLLRQTEVKRSEVEALCHQLLLHMEVEEKYFYPVMKKMHDTRELAEESVVEHQEAKKGIRDLLSGKLDDIEYKTKLELLQLQIEHHVQEEEGEFFPKAKKLLSEEQIQAITDQMTALKQKDKMASQTRKK